MEETNKMICADEVISIENGEDQLLINHPTYQAIEFLKQLGIEIDARNPHRQEKWIDKGVPCKMLSPNQNWQKGKIKICLQFIPDQPESVLDDVRPELDLDNV